MSTVNVITSNDIGDGLQVTGGQLEVDFSQANLNVQTQQLPGVIGFVTADANGNITSQSGGITVTRTAVGRYTTTPPAGAVTSMSHCLEPLATRDDIATYPVDHLHASLYVVSQDNGGTSGSYVDRPFSVVWYGLTTQVTGVTS